MSWGRVCVTFNSTQLLLKKIKMKELMRKTTSRHIRTWSQYFKEFCWDLGFLRLGGQQGVGGTNENVKSWILDLGSWTSYSSFLKRRSPQGHFNFLCVALVSPSFQDNKHLFEVRKIAFTCMQFVPVPHIFRSSKSKMSRPLVSVYDPETADAVVGTVTLPVSWVSIRGHRYLTSNFLCICV